MSTFFVYIISLILIVLLFIMKSWEIYYGRKIFLERQFENFDAWIHKIIIKVKYSWSQVSFKNTKRVVFWAVDNTRKMIISIKKRLDHKQSHFFAKKENDILKNKKQASFFLKDISEYKKSLREEGGIKED